MRSATLTPAVVVLALISLAPGVVTAQDAVIADSAHHKVEFENAQVRVVRYTIPPHDKTAPHEHPNNLQVMLTDHNGRVTTADGKTTEVHGKAGQVAWRTATKHVVENIGDKPIEGILVEPRIAGATAGLIEESDPVKVDPQHNKIEFENDQVRVLRYHYGPHEKSPMHDHPDNVQVLLTDSNGRITTADGKVTEAQRKAGEAAWRTATKHTVENVGDQPYEGILVELKGKGQSGIVQH
jgi:quercetin dioxygenase-like cupin family protein